MPSGLDVLLVCDDIEHSPELVTGLKDSGAATVFTASINDNVLKILSNQVVDLVVLDVARPTMNLFEQFAVVQAYCPKPVICFSDDRDSNVIAQSVKAGVTAYIVDGKSPDRLKPIIEVAMLRFNQCQAVKKELAQVKDKLSERAIIEKAKGLLIEHKNMSEDQAYKMMRKLAMDQGKKITVIAHEICDVIAAIA